MIVTAVLIAWFVAAATVALFIGRVVHVADGREPAVIAPPLRVDDLALTAR